jgi:prevent-host-death family protein
MSELPIEQAQAHLGEVVEDAERAGEVIYLTRHGRRVAAIVSPELAAEIEIEQAEEEADIAAARAALDEGGEPIPWEQVKAELGL